MQLTVNITQEILEKSKMCGIGEEKNSGMIGQNCAIGCAIVDLFGLRSWVGCSHIIIYEGDIDPSTSSFGEIVGSIPLPIEAFEFIEKFDRSSPTDRVNIKPFNFNIEVPDDLLETLVPLNMDEIRNLISNSKSLSLVESF